jgi:hypothetical protein
VDDVCHSLIARPDDSHWTIVTAAPVTSQVIGVFAAVVFTGVILLFQQAPPSEDSDHYRYSSRALVTMLCSFVSLSLASFLFSVVSGEELCGRAFAEGVAAGALFGIGATGMFSHGRCSLALQGQPRLKGRQWHADRPYPDGTDKILSGMPE